MPLAAARLAEAITPTAFRARLAAMTAQDPAVQVLSWMLGPERILEWAHTVAAAADPALRRLVPPLPPREMRQVTAAQEEQVFLWTGLVDLRQVLAVFERQGGRAAGATLNVLDFGCGCGRVLRFLDAIDGVRASGAEVNPDLVGWCRNALPRSRVELTGPLPPLPFATAEFDLVLSLSVFSHLPEPRAMQWLDELGRVLRPGGLLLTTTHGEPALSIIAGSPQHQQMFGIDAVAANTLRERLPRDGYLYLPYGGEVLAIARAGAEYGNAFVDAGRVADRWNGARFEFVEHIPGGLRGWQDMVVLRRR